MTPLTFYELLLGCVVGLALVKLAQVYTKQSLSPGLNICLFLMGVMYTLILTP